MTDEFQKTTIKKLGSRGNIDYEQTARTADLDTLEERIEEVDVAFCECGARLAADMSEVYRCCLCDVICCPACRIRHTKYHYCTTCAMRQFELDKHTFLTLLFIQHDLLTSDDLIQVTAHDDEVFDLQIDTAADVLVDHDYLTEAGTLSAAGTEALAVGRQVFEEDSDVRAVIDHIRLTEVAERG